MKLTVTLISLAVTIVTVNAVAIPSVQNGALSQFQKRAAAPNALAAPQENDDENDDNEDVGDVEGVEAPGDQQLDPEELEPLTPEEEALLAEIIGKEEGDPDVDIKLFRRDGEEDEEDDDDVDLDDVEGVDAPGDQQLDENEQLEPLTPEEEALLNEILNLPEDTPEDKVTGLARRDGTLERRGIIDKLVKLLLKKISKTNLAKKVWNYLSKTLRKQITKYLKSKAKTAGKVTKKMKNWVKSKIRPAVKAILKSMIGGWAAGKIVEHVLPWIVDLIIKIVY